MSVINILVGSWHRTVLPVVHRVRASKYYSFDLFWDFSRRYFFALAVLALLGAKALHLYAHLHSLPFPKFLLWGITFFFQDVIAILLLRIATRKMRHKSLAVVAAIVVIPLSLIMSGMASANTSFYIVTGAEIHWRQAKTFHRDEAAVRTLLTGLTGFLIVEAILLSISWTIARTVHHAVGRALEIIMWPFWLCISRIFPRGQQQELHISPETYERVADEDQYEDKSDFDDLEAVGSKTHTSMRAVSTFARLGTFLTFIVLLAMRALRPVDPSYIFLSGALPLTPFVDARHRMSPVDTAGMPGDYRFLEGRTAMTVPPPFPWLSPIPMPGFEDWDPNDPSRLHYSPDEDPLHISNLDQPVLEPLRQALADGTVRIKHIIVLKLESTRADLFPLRNESFIWHKIADSYRDREVPEEVKEFVGNLTRTAEYLTGFSTGFRHQDNFPWKRRAYGGISARNALTTATYTLKSLVGTVCGVTPLVADFNLEYNHHIYQPCMPHVLNAINHQQDVTSDTEDFIHWPWHSMWMQSVTDGYDNQDLLTPVLGFHDVQTKETIKNRRAKHYPPHTKEINYYGYADTELREYLRDAIDDAQRNRTRLFLTHLTGTTHHPWALPDDNFQKIIRSSWMGENKKLNRYLNTIHFVDNWLAEILGILEEKGVADETLIAIAGDHGLSLPNDGGSTPYDNPHIGSFQIPIVLAHPHLPPVEITTPVMSDQIVPTILDLLIESSSLSPNGTTVAGDVRALYEGQSMIRPLAKEEENIQDWQFTVMNTGGSWLAVRSAARPGYRLVIPLIDDLEWRFTNLAVDPNELHPIKDFNLVDLAKTLDAKYGEDAVNWLRDAAHIAEWWVGENWRRYGYGTPETTGTRNMTEENAGS
ncbi:alkaline-phosphatase-like protein [Aspergillus ambiguus]|uniref:sulfatase domain protein n=1 Tax=Aspergillus ambiguus TaxID=176160 RepID=UPI003CCDB94A